MINQSVMGKIGIYFHVPNMNLEAQQFNFTKKDIKTAKKFS